MKFRVFALFVLLALVLSACTVTPALPSPVAEVDIEDVAAFEESPCPFSVPADGSVVCGYVTVPEDHNDPTGPTIRIAVGILKDRSENHQPDPVIVLAGGPGEKVMENAAALEMVLGPIHPNRDLIVFDQRGVGLSEPALECLELVPTYISLLNEADPEVIEESIFSMWIGCHDRLVSEGHNLSAYNTVQNAADVDAIRRVLGYDQVNLYGGSYGSLLAQATMRDFPNGIRSVIIDSVLPLEKSLFVDASITTSNAILHLLDACVADEACNAAYPDLHGVLYEVIDRLNAEPVPITVTNPLDGQSYDALLTGDGVLSNLVTFLYITEIIPVLPQAIADVHNGDYQLMTQLSSTKLALLEALSRGMMFSVMCAEDLIGKQPQDLLDNWATLPRQLTGNGDPEVLIENSIFNICENWSVDEADPRVKQPLVSDIPTLVLAGEFDPVTPPEYGRLVAGYLENSYFFEFAGLGHSVIPDNECVQRIAGSFVENPTQAPDASCMDEMPGIVFDLPVEDAEVVLGPYTSEAVGVSGAIPMGWTEVSPGIFARANTALDLAAFQVAAAPTTAQSILDDLTSGYGLAETPESIGEREVNNLTWVLYAFDVQGVPRDLALAESDGLTLVVILRSAVSEREVLHETVFLPIVDSLTPFVAETENEVEDETEAGEGESDGEITLVSFTSETFGISGVVPEGWGEIAAGVNGRSSEATDVVRIIQQAAPGATAAQIAAALAPQLGVESFPEPVGSVETADFTWAVYLLEVEAPGVGTVLVDVALADTDVGAYLIIMQALTDEYDALHEAVFLPALEALVLVE